ncbi:MAG TPA: hypothetical protein VL332_01190 [Candidatus Saccharimonadaceae bacterium]|nr:hypothetical protein [Candidatus Saccharimonadaceae bacterium]
MAVDNSRVPWTTKIEKELRRLRDVEDVRIEAEGEAIRTIHVMSSSTRSPKMIVRDVQSLLVNLFNRPIDHRIVSVAFVDAGSTAAPAPARLVEVPAPEPPPAPEAPLDDRIRFGSVNLYVAGPRTQAQVELRWKGVPRMGSASGWSTRDGAHRLIAAATLAAVQEFLDDDVALSVADLSVVRMGRHEVVVAGLSLLAHRTEKLLVGSCTVEQDAQQAVVLATLGALNRVVGAFRTKEPTEYVLRPSSDQEKSGAHRG